MKTNKTIAKKIISVLLMLAFLVSSFSGIVLTASAAEAGVSYIERSWNASSKTVSSVTKSAQATVVAANDSSWGQEGKVTYYVVNSAVTSTRDRIDVYGEVHLILNQKFSMSGRIVVPANGALHIHEALSAQNATLEIDYILSNGTAVAIHGGTVTTPRTYGVIRKGLEIRDGNFYLYSGTVNATIGKFSQASSDGSIFIYGGTVNAYTDDAIGLISADSGAYDAIKIYNATVKGYRTVEALHALIGGKKVGKIIIHNSNVDVDYDGYEGTRGNQTHGIGGGSSDSRISEITITNSTVSVWGGGAGSGIGGYVDTITLKDSTVRAFSGDYSMPKGTGIGSRYCTQIIIDGGSVMTDTADENSDWTGKGYYAKNITIKKGTVDAHEGLHLNGGNMVITGGNVLGTINDATPVNNDGTTLYARQITLTGAADGTAVSAVTGLPSYYNLDGMRTIGSDICVWVPSAHVPSVVSLGNNQYGGAMLGGEANQTATFGKLHTCTDGNSDGLCDQCEELMPPSMENGFYLIYDLEDYQYLKKLVEGTLKSGLANRNANAKLMANIEIGSTTIGTADFPYGGVFDGNFKSLTVARRYETRNGTDPVAPFLYADGATFKRLTMEGSIYVDHYNRQIRTTDIGGFVAITTGNPVTFEQCINKASVEANNYTTPTVNLGGFVGMNYTTLTFNNCASLGTIKTSKASGGSGYVGNSAATSPVYANDCYIYLTMAVAGNNADANSYFCRNEDYTFLSNTYECLTMQRYNGNQGWINGHNNENKDGENDITSVEVAQINDGTVAYKLNKGNANGVWKQTLTGATPDQYPVFAGANVVPNITTGHYDNHNHTPTYELATVNVKNDSVRVSCPECAPDGMNITVSIEDGTTYIWYDKPEATITHPGLVDFYYMKGDTVLKTAPRDAGNYTVNFEYGGIKASVPYSILPRSIENATVTSSGTLIYSGQPQSATFSVYDSGTLEEGVDYTLSNHQQTDAGTYEVTITGIGNYTGTQTVKFTIRKATNSWKVSPSIEDWTYGDEAKQPVYEARYGTVAIRYTGETNGGQAYDSDKLPTQAGRYTATFTVTGENYTNLSSTVSFEIRKAALTVNADDKTITYGDAAPNYTVSYDGFVNGDDPDDLKGTLITSCEYAQFDDKGTYSIIPSGYTSDNYEITYKNGTVTVSPKPITVTIDDQNSVYGQDIVTLTATTDGIVNNDQNVYSLSTTATKTSDAGDYAITGATLNDNYDITFVNGKYTITKAAATVVTAPTPNTLTYNKQAHALITAGTAAGGEMQYSLDGKTYDPAVPTATNAGTYTVYYKVVGDNNHSDTAPQTVTVTIEQKALDLSAVTWNYTKPFKYDGLTHSVAIDESTLPEGASVSNYTGHSGVETGSFRAVASITYDANYKGVTTLLLDWEIKNDWTPTEYTVSAPNGNGWVNQDFVITAANGYLISTTNTATGEWKDALTYSTETADGSVTFYLKSQADGTISLAKTVTYKLDKTAPTGKVEFVERIGWEEFIHNITFGLFYKDEVTVRVTEQDNLSAVAKIEYACSDTAMTLEEVKEIADWTEYNGSFGVTLPEAQKFVYFIRLTDHAGNVTFLSTNGAEYDKTAPVVSGVENGKTYYTTQKVSATDRNIKTVTVNGTPVFDPSEFSLPGDTDVEFVISATDAAGIATIVTVTMKPIDNLSVPIDALTTDNVNSSHEGDVDDVQAAVAAVDTTDATEEEKAALKEIADQAAALAKRIDDAGQAINTENIQKVRDVTAENVAPEDKTDLEKAKADLEQALAVYERNYTENETNTIRDEIKRIDDALRSIENAAAVDELLKTLPDSVTPQNKIDEAIVRDVKAAYDTLSDREKEILNEQNKGKLEQFVAILAAGCKGNNTCPSLPFKDIDVKAWYHHGVDYVITNGYMVGYPNHTFAPGKAINRAEMVQILYNLEGRPNVSGRDAFGDTANKAWYSKAILWASQTGLVAGYGNGNFGPEDLITREQMVSILWRYAKYKGIDVLTDEATTLAGFDDAENVSRWALPAVKWAIQTKIMRGIPSGGKKYIAANETATRAQAAVMLRRFDKM